MPRRPPPTFARRLRVLRAAAGLSVQQLAAAAGLSREAVRLLESGTREPGWATLCRLADALRLPLDSFR